MRNARPIAIALFDETDVPSVEEFVSRHKATWEDEDPPRTVQKQGESAVIAVGEDQFTFAAFRKPFAWSSLEGPCSTAWWWHNAADEIRSHGSHVVIMPLEDPFDPVDIALDLTRLAGTLCKFKNCSGILWPTGTVVHPPDGFFQQAKKASTEFLPLLLWVDFRIAPDELGRYYLFTTGMDAFGKREIEVLPSHHPPQIVIERAFDIAHYVLASDVKLGEGETVGTSHDERIPIKVGTSMAQRDIEVLSLELPDELK